MLLQPEPALDEEESLLARMELELVAQRTPEVIRQQLVQRARGGILFKLAALHDLELPAPHLPLVEACSELRGVQAALRVSPALLEFALGHRLLGGLALSE
eukprot:12258077-Alexandrium_andersonii.AAC.1